MNEVKIIGLNLAKNVYQAHGAEADGSVILRRKLLRAQLLKFLGYQHHCVGAMKACASALSLGSRDRRSRARSPVDHTGHREAVRKAPEENPPPEQFLHLAPNLFKSQAKLLPRSHHINLNQGSFFAFRRA